MKIVGLQKLTLLDYPGKVACTVFLGGCNFRCPFCHNSGLLEGGEPLMEVPDFVDFLRKRTGLLDAVCVSGGEPTLHPDLLRLLSQIKELGFSIKLDTNGYRPDVLKAAVQAKLVDYVAMDIKNAPSHYSKTTGCEQISLAPLEQSIRFLVTGSIGYELRTTVVQELHSEASILEMGQWLAEVAAPYQPKKLFLQPFVNRDSVLQDGLHAPLDENLEKYVTLLAPYVGEVSIRGV